MNIQDIWERIVRRLGIGQRRFDVFGDVDELGLLRTDQKQDDSFDRSDSAEQSLIRKPTDKPQSLETAAEGSTG